MLEPSHHEFPDRGYITVQVPRSGATAYLVSLLSFQAFKVMFSFRATS